MAEPSLISAYLDTLSGQLPGRAVEELADGLEETYLSYLERGQPPDAAERAALTEFGAPRTVIRAFAEASNARRTARRLLAAGPFVGICWAVALLTARASSWPVPVTVRILVALAVITVIGLLGCAARSQRYRAVRVSAVFACVGTGLVDIAMVAAVTAVAPAMGWPLAMAIAASGTRLSYAALSFRKVLAR